MATISPPSHEAAELLQKLSLNSNDSPLQHHPPHQTSATYAFDQPFERSANSPRPDFMHPSMFYTPAGYPPSTYYYRGFNGSSVNDWDWYGTSNGVEMPPGVYGDYQNSFGYAPYTTYSSSGSNMGHDNPIYVPQNLQYPTSYFQPSGRSNGPYTASVAKTSPADLSTSVAADQVQLSTGTPNGNHRSIGNDGSNRNYVSRPNYQAPSTKSNDFYGWGGLPSGSSVNSSAFLYGNNFSSRRDQNRLPFPHVMDMQHQQAGSGMNQARFTNQMYNSNRIYGQYPSLFRGGAGYVSNSCESRVNMRGWLAVDNKYRSGGCGSSSSLVYGNESVDGLHELNKGPRAKGFKDQKDSEPITVAVKGQNLPLKGKTDKDNLPVFPDKECFNREDFPEVHSDAKFFIIKSYSEDDVHKSIKYGVWTSTPNGNKKLDAAYKEAQEKSGGCPVFLLFSVNASGQFVGLAEMVGPVDFDKCMEYWQQDKWTGWFPVKWHIIKDVPNSMLRHLTLENNENKPVTNSRDTQEVKFEQGIEIIKIFKRHSSNTCILDDFEFYERRQRAIQEKKAKPQQFNEQVGNMASRGADKDGLLSKEGSQTSVDLCSTLTENLTAPKSAVPGVNKTGANLMFLKDDRPVPVDEDTLNGLHIEKENKALSNGVTDS
ncbi:hypothetical protein ACH5RR_007568 [Cinchona calisaya]|uniref:YTH domain-containing family protein n=1 Tax=Cinchona calisaya TaxID=153742 RepID=A0ABD3AS66_9GENT